MAYIGAEPVPGQNREVDDISSGFNGNATAFTLQVSSVNVSPESANNILINLGGVIQNPGTDYTIAASTLTFTTAPAAGLSFFGLILGAGINTATVADDTIGPSKLIDTAVTAGSYTTADITVDAQGRVTAAANGTIATAEIADQAVTNAKVNNSAAIDYSKLATLADGNILVGNGSGVATSVNPSGDIDISNTGAFSIASGVIVNADVNNSAAIAGSKISPDFGSQNISTTGNIQISSDSSELKLGASQDFRLFHNGSTNKIIAQNAELLVQCESYSIRSENGGTIYGTINTSGFLGLGTTSPSTRLHVDAGTTTGTTAIMLENDDNTAYSSAAEGHINSVLTLKSTTTTGQNDQSVGIQFSLALSGQTGSIQEIAALRTGNGEGALVFRTRSSSEGRREKMRIKSDGSVCVATTSSTVNSSNFGIVLGSDGSGGMFKNAGGSADIFRAGGNAGLANIFGDGDITNTNNSYGQASDETLKQDIVDAASQWNDIKNLRVRKFRFKDNPTGVLQIGVVAQEIEKVSAGLVQEDDEGIKSVKYSVLYMKAVKCLQEAMTRIETLETEVAALKAA